MQVQVMNEDSLAARLGGVKIVLSKKNVGRGPCRGGRSKPDRSSCKVV